MDARFGQRVDQQELAHHLPFPAKDSNRLTFSNGRNGRQEREKE
jgi:hypothetical protein